jgi:apolipoprotein N-acyltransferase
MKHVFYQRQLDFTGSKNTKSPNVVIWPETAISKLLKDSDVMIEEISNTAGSKASVILGIVRKENNKSRNSLVLINEQGDLSAIFDKQHLVPFGEYMPMANLLKNIGLSNLIGLAGNFEPGNRSRIINAKNIPKFLALICYEAIFPNYSNEIKNRPDWIVQITNDAWFGNFSGPYQHLAQARIRAIEQGLPFVRSANTGISAMIDPYGRVLNKIELEASGYFDAALPSKIQPTPYSKFGELFLALFCGLLLLACFANMYRKRNIE